MKNRVTVIAGLFSSAVLMFAAAPAMARADVSIHIGAPGFYVQPAPVYVQQRPMYAQPQPSYYSGQHYRPVRYQRNWDTRYRARGDLDRDGIPNRHDRDRDGDGVPNRFDRRPNNPYRN